MKIYLSGRILETSRQDYSLEDFAELAQETGYDGINLRKYQIAQLKDEKSILLLSEMLTKMSMDICTINPPRDMPIGSVVDLARKLNIKIIRTDPTPEHLGKIDADMQIGQQMHTRGPLETIDSAAEFISNITDHRAGVIVEPANLILARITDWTEDMFMPLKDRIIGCHYQSLEVSPDGESELSLLDDSLVKYKRVQPTLNSQINLPLFMKALKKIDYDEFINVIVPEHDDMSIKELAQDANQAIRKALAEVNE